jgi:Tol biopolymer transport system component
VKYAVVFLFLWCLPLRGQLVPHDSWRTIATEHFRVHFTPPLEEAAQRAASQAEVAWQQLSAELRPPRGVIDLIIADNVDFTNGSATPFPTNRIIIYASPPTASRSLRFYDDWSELVITHELVHIFHLDRSAGWWGLARKLFGRAPVFMPNFYTPAWVTEGLATYYESRLTSAGRVHGTHHEMIARASALANDVPPPAEWSAATARYPWGEVPYAFGSLFFDYLARTRGPETVPRFVERTSRFPIPFFLGRASRSAFGISFGDAFREWRDTLARAVAGASPVPIPGWRDLTREGRLALTPRWSSESALVFAAVPAKDVPGVYVVDTTGRVHRLARRNGADVNVPLSGGGVLFAQLEFTSPWHIRSDLWLERGGRSRRLTSDARLGEPDVRRDGAIVAVQGAPATNRLVRVTMEGSVTPLTRAHPDTQWAEPRWSPRGDRIAAVRWTYGGFGDVVVLDTLGALVARVTSDRAVDASPSWTADGRWLFFSSDRTGVTQLYAVPADSLTADDGANGALVRRLSSAATGLFEPEPSPAGERLAAVHYRNDGFHVGIAPLDTIGLDRPATSERFTTSPPRLPQPSQRPHGRYSPFRTLLPRYWLPTIGESSRGATSVGGFTSASDVVGRHAWSTEVAWSPEDDEVSGSMEWVWRGLGLPVVDVVAAQSWDAFTILDNADNRIGALLERTREVSLGLTLERPRVRTNSWLTVGAEYEWLRYTSDPAPVIDGLTFSRGRTPSFRGGYVSGGWSNARRPPLAISLEDGIQLGGFARQRWLASESRPWSKEVLGVLSMYKSLDLPGYAHHVLAARVAAGWSDGVAPEVFSVGGESGASVEVLPGVRTGTRRTFGVRGWSPASREGTRALATSVEWRFPVTLATRGTGPLFFDRLSGTVFADAGAGWNPGPVAWIASAGAELALDIAWLYDDAYRLRLGAARPIAGAARGNGTIYVLLGTSF